MQYPSTLIRYASVLETFLAMLLRPQDSYHTHYPDTLVAAVDQLRSACLSIREHSPDSPEMEPLIDQVLTHLWIVDWPTSSAHPLTDPTLRFIMLKSMDSNGSFQDPKLVTPLLAKLKYLIRVYMVRCLTAPEPHKKTPDQLQPWYWEKQQRRHSTFNMVADLQHQASFLALSTQEMPSIRVRV